MFSLLLLIYRRIPPFKFVEWTTTPNTLEYLAFTTHYIETQERTLQLIPSNKSMAIKRLLLVE